MGIRADILTDLDTIFDINDFGEQATLATGTIINGIIYEPFDDAFGVENYSLAFIGKTSDLSALVHGNTLVINAVTYYVIGIENIRIGMILLKLSKTA